MHLLHSVLVPISRVINKQRIKYTITDSQNAFTLLVDETGDIEQKLESKREICLQNGTCMQPLIIVVGDHHKITNFFVALDNIKFQFNSYLSALDFCFKIFYVLNLEYPHECSLVWTFVQQYFFDIKLDEYSYPTIDTFIGDLNS